MTHFLGVFCLFNSYSKFTLSKRRIVVTGLLNWYDNVKSEEKAPYFSAKKSNEKSKEGYKTADTSMIYQQIEEVETVNGWHPVLPVQLEVHVPMESTEAPQVETALAYEDGIVVLFSQYMKEETLEDIITVTQGDESFTGDDINIIWLDQEMSKHYYKCTFSSEMVISRADGQMWKDKVTVSIADGGINYVDTSLSRWSEELTVIPKPVQIQAVDSMELQFCGERNFTVRILDQNQNQVPDVMIEAVGG